MITPDLKDEILKYLVLSTPHRHYSGEIDEDGARFNISGEVLNQILLQFERRGFVRYEPYMGGGFFLDILADADDYILHGGYLGEYQYIEMQVQQLKNALYEFEASFPKEKFERIKGIMDTMLAAAATYHSFLS